MKKKFIFLCLLSLSFYANAQHVGINTTNPQATLDVRGNIRLGGINHFTAYDSISGKIDWRNSNLYVPVTQYLMQHSAAGDGLFYNNSGGVSGQLEYRNEFGNPVFFTNFTNGKGYFKGRLGISTINPLAGLHVADSSVLFSVTGDVPATPGSMPISGAGRRMMWYPDKAAFRTGFVIGDHWDTYNVGNYSFASGSNTNASGSSSSAMGAGSIASGIASTSLGRETIADGDYSTAMGFGTNASGFLSIAMGSYTIASGQNSTALGNTAIASGDYSFAMGQNINARSIYETVLGRWNTDYTPSGANTDRLFSIGNGTSPSLRSDAMTVLKNGNVGIGTITPVARLHVNENSVLFSSAGNITGIPGLPPMQGQGRRMMWYADKAAFRVGYVDGLQWDKDFIGNYSFAAGFNAAASGTYSISMGALTIASGELSTAIGTATLARSGYETAIGVWNTDYAPANISGWVGTDRLFTIGNGTDPSLRSDALVILKNGNTGIRNSTPGFPLSFATAVGDKISLWSNSSNSYGFGIQSALLQIHTDISASDIAFGYGSSSSFFETMRVKGNGILQFPATLAKKITLYPGTTGDVGFGVQGNQLLIYADHPAAMVRLGYDQAGVFTNNLDVYGNGNAWLRGTLTQASDSRLKKDINPLQNSLQKITQLNGYNYNWKNENADKSLQTGVLAQEVQKLFPNLVKEDKDGLLAVNYSGLIPVLIESIKQQQQMIEQQQRQINELRKMMEGAVRKE